MAPKSDVFTPSRKAQWPRAADANALPINTRFAEKYEASKRRELLSTVPSAVLDASDDSSSSSEDEDEFGELLTRRMDRQVRDTINALRKKDPRIYDSSATFYDDPPSNASQDEHSDQEPVAGWDAIADAAKRAIPKLTLKDYVRETLLKDGRLSDSDSETQSAAKHNKTERKPVLSTDPDARKSKADDTHSDDGDDDNDFFTKKSKTDAELQEEQKDFDAFLKKQAAKSASKTGDNFLLHSYLEKENPDQKERFLFDFVLNNGWLDSNAAPAPAAHDYDIEIDRPDPDLPSHQAIEEQDDEYDSENDRFEAKYNFRFEDPEGAQLVSHARNVPESVRRPDDRRKIAREARSLRKQQEKAAKIEDIKRLRNLKKKEIQARLLAIQEAAGDQVDVSAFDLDADFDPDKFNKQMEKNFGDEYYAREDNQMNKRHEHDETGALRPPLRDSSSMPDDVREDVSRMVDEYYNLNYEDIIGGAPVRFKYKKVDPESFYMTTEDILAKDDKELNRLVSLKYLSPYRSDREIKKKAWKAAKIMKSQSTSQEKTANGYHGKREGAAEQNGGAEEKTEKRKRRRQSLGQTENGYVADRENPVQENGDDEKKHKKQKKREKSEGQGENGYDGERKNPVHQNGDDEKKAKKQKKSHKSSGQTENGHDGERKDSVHLKGDDVKKAKKQKKSHKSPGRTENGHDGERKDLIQLNGDGGKEVKKQKKRQKSSEQTEKGHDGEHKDPVRQNGEDKMESKKRKKEKQGRTEAGSIATEN